MSENSTRDSQTAPEKAPSSSSDDASAAASKADDATADDATADDAASDDATPDDATPDDATPDDDGPDSSEPPLEAEPKKEAAGKSRAGAKPVPDPAPGPPKYLFMAVVASLVLITDAVTKAWAETTLAALPPTEPVIVLIEDVLNFHLAYNKGGAFGMLSSEDDTWRGPFFLLISFAAVAFIVSLYRRVAPNQWALRWGLPLVLGGALGNLADRIAKGQVVDFIDYKAGWVRFMNETINRFNDGWHITSHWPTFNVADVCICTGVGLMAVDMFTSSRASAGEGTGNAAKDATVG